MRKFSISDFQIYPCLEDTKVYISVNIFFSFGHFIGNLYWLSMVTGDPGPERLTFQLAMLKSLTLSKSFPVGTMHIFLERPIGGEMLVYSINFFKKFFAKWEVWYLE